MQPSEDAPGGQQDPSPGFLETGGYASPVDVLLEAETHEDYPNGPIRRVVLNMQAGGDATWSVWAVEEDTPYGGYVAPPE